MYESMIEYRETGRDFLYGRKGVVNLPSALLREKRFLAGNNTIFQDICTLEGIAEREKIFNTELVNFSIEKIVSAIKQTLDHPNEDGDRDKFGLDDKISAVSEIIIAYKSLCLNSRVGGTNSQMLPFWELFREKLQMEKNNGESN